jgi:hypothetical protein
MSVRITERLDERRVRVFKDRLRSDRGFLQEFREDPIRVLDRELGIVVDPRSRFADELLKRVKEKREDDWMIPPAEATCVVVSAGSVCIVVAVRPG